MRKHNFRRAVPILGSVIFCASALAQDALGPQPRLTMLGVVTEPSDRGKYVFADFDKVAIGAEGNSIRAKLPLMTPGGQPEPIEVWDAAVHIEVLQRSPKSIKYDVVLGPELCKVTDPKYLCHGDQKVGSGWVGRYEGYPEPFKGATHFHLEQGWALFWSSPSEAHGETDWVTGGTEGTMMLLEIVDATKQRIYFLHGDKMTYGCKLNQSAEKVHKTVNEYLEVTTDADGENCLYGAGWEPIPTSGDIYNFVEQAKKMAEAFGWQPSP